MLKIKRGTSATLSDVILENGQPAYCKDTHELKIGNGNTAFSELPVVGSSLINCKISVNSTGWEDTTKTLAGFEAKYSNSCICTGAKPMSTVIDISYNDGDLESAKQWIWLAPEENSVVLYSKTKPAKNFSLNLVLNK